MARRFKKGDRVVVLTGKDKGKRGDVLKVIPEKARALVQGVNVAKRHQRQSANPGRRHRLQGNADAHFQPGARGSQGRQADAGRLPDFEGWTQGPFAKRSGEVIDG